MDAIWLLILLPIAAGSGWFAATRTRRRGPVDSLPSAYFRGLNFLLNEQHDKALEILVTALEQDKDTVEVQLALGSLFRKRGEIQRATCVHQNLVARTQLEKGQRFQALYELAQDYYKAGLLDRAEHLLVEISGVEEMGESVQQLLLQIYEQEKEWENSIRVAKKLETIIGSNLSGMISQYHCEIAENGITEGRYAEALSSIQEAMLVDRNCIRAIIQAGRLKAIQGDHRGAIDDWLTGVSEHSEFPGEIADLIGNSYRHIGALDEYHSFLEKVLQKNGDVRLALALTEVLREVKEGDVAENFLLGWVRSNPSMQGLHRLIQLRMAKAGVGESGDIGLLEKLIGGIVEQEAGYECRQCGFRGKVMHWQCPGCRKWNTTFLRQQLERISYATQ